MPYLSEKMHGSSVQLQPCVVRVLLIAGSISPSSRGRLPSRAGGWLLAGDKVLSLPGCKGTAAPSEPGESGGSTEESRRKSKIPAALAHIRAPC